jgi:predicted O-methyltransferase YrrM
VSDLLQRIFDQSSVTDEKGNVIQLHSHTPEAQCKFLDEIIRLVKPSASIEVGLAYGISTLQIIHSMASLQKGFTHVVMDPFQHEWNNIGMLNISRSGYAPHVRFFSERSSVILPRLLGEGLRVQFAYIDSTKVFDQLVVDVHYITTMLDNGGVIVLDDCDFPGIRLLARMLARHPSFVVLKGFSPDPVTLKSRVAGKIISWWIAMMPLRKRKLARLDPATDEDLGVNYKCIAFRKKEEDKRPWNWHKPF